MAASAKVKVMVMVNVSVMVRVRIMVGARVRVRIRVRVRVRVRVRHVFLSGAPALPRNCIGNPNPHQSERFSPFSHSPRSCLGKNFAQVGSGSVAC